MTTEKLAKKIKMSNEFVKGVILEGHLRQFIPKKNLVTMEFELDPAQVKWLYKVAKCLKVEVDAVFSYCMKGLIESHK